MGLVFAESQMVGSQGLEIHRMGNRKEMNGLKGVKCSLTLKKMDIVGIRL